MHKDWCGKPCSECTNHCRLDESIACSPDCEFLGENGEHKHPACQDCDALPLYRVPICYDVRCALGQLPPRKQEKWSAI